MISALILAGGRATRMGGIAKHELLVEGATIFSRQTSVLAPLVDEILVSTPTDIATYRCVRDVEGAVGPLAGVAAGLAATRGEWLLVLAGDMPYIDAPLVERMLAARARDGVGLRVNGLPEPLVCLVRVAPARVALGELLAQGRFKASGLLAALDVVWIEDADPRALRNINRPGDIV